MTGDVQYFVIGVLGTLRVVFLVRLGLLMTSGCQQGCRASNSRNSSTIPGWVHMSHGAAPVKEFMDMGPCLDTWDTSTLPVPYIHPPTRISITDEFFGQDPLRIFGDPLLFFGMLDDTPSLWIKKIVRQFYGTRPVSQS